MAMLGSSVAVVCSIVTPLREFPFKSSPQAMTSTDILVCSDNCCNCECLPVPLPVFSVKYQDDEKEEGC